MSAGGARPGGRRDASVLAFDVGGTHLRSARRRPDGALSGRRERTTPRDGGAALLAALGDEARAQLAGARAAGEAPPAALGLAIAGLVDTAAGRVVFSPSLDLHGLDLAGPLSREVGLPVRLVNDVNAAAWAEAGARGARDLAAVFVGTGVGTGLVAGGRLLEGHRGAAAEGGHVRFRDGGGATLPRVDAGCYEAFLGGEALAARGRAAGVGGDARGVAAAARAGDARARAILGDAEAAIGALVTALVLLLDPELVVVGGGVARGVPELLAAARRAVDPHPLAASLGAVQVQAARVDEDAGLHGAGLLALGLAGGGEVESR